MSKINHKSNSFYIFLPNDDQQNDYMYDEHLLGESDINGSFWTGTGMKILLNITNTKPELIESVIIKDQTGKAFTVEQFIKIVEKLKIKQTE